MQAPKFLHRIRVLIHPYVPKRIFFGVDKVDRGGALTLGIAALIVISSQRLDQPVDEWASPEVVL